MMTAKLASRPLWLDVEPSSAAPAPRVICAWCPDFNPLDPANANASHGMCPRCVAKFETRSAA
jgi:hypothetical protein